MAGEYCLEFEFGDKNEEMDWKRCINVGLLNRYFLTFESKKNSLDDIPHFRSGETSEIIDYSLHVYIENNKDFACV